MYHPQGTHVVPGMTPEQRRRAQRWEMPAVAVALLVIPYLLLNHFQLGRGFETVVDVLYVGIWGFFVVEALAMLRLAPDNWAWAKRNVLDIATIAPVNTADNWLHLALAVAAFLVGVLAGGLLGSARRGPGAT